MAVRVLIRQRAYQDLEEISDYLCKSSIALASRFLDAADATFADLAKNPGLGAPSKLEHPFVAQIRHWRTKGFRKYLIFYAPVENGVRIYRVLHGSLDLERALADD